MTRFIAVAAVLVALGLAGCAQMAANAPAGGVLAPNENLVAQGIPPIPQSLVDRVQAYTEFRSHGFVDWHPRQRQMLVSHRKAGDNLSQLYLVRGPLAEPEQLTQDAEPVSSGSFEPRDGRYVVFERSIGGNEATQLFRLDLDTRQTTLLTDPNERHDLVAWIRPSGELLHSSLPLDRTAQGGTRAEISTTYWRVDPLQPGSRQQVAVLPGGGWFGGAVSRDGRQLALTRYISAAESQIWLVDLASGRRRQLLPAPADTHRASHLVAEFSHDGKRLFFSSNRAGEFNGAMVLDLDSGAVGRIGQDIAWDVAGISLSGDGTTLAVEFNVEGRDELRLFDAAALNELPVPAVPEGSVGSSLFHPARAELAFSLVGADSPGQVWTLDAPSGRFEQWTRAYLPPELGAAAFPPQQIVRWKGHDGLPLSGLLSMPPARFAGRRPVIVDIHGGPEAQAKVSFLGRWNYFVNELGVAVLRPNVRGSSGFGKTFLSLDDGMKREDSVKDIGALLDWIAAQPTLDAARVLVSGGSYGGYMSLAVSTHYADRIAGAVDVVGISHFVSFLTHTESYRRDLRRVEYGDERDPAMRAFLDRISPLSNAGRISKPLFVVQGKNDPRVPYTEAEQIVERARANGTPVWYLRAENEGHGFLRKENADFYLYALVRFVESVLLEPREHPMPVSAPGVRGETHLLTCRSVTFKSCFS